MEVSLSSMLLLKLTIKFLHIYFPKWRNEGMLIFILDFGEIFFELYYWNISLMKKVAMARPGTEPRTLRSAVWQSTNWDSVGFYVIFWWNLLRSILCKHFLGEKSFCGETGDWTQDPSVCSLRPYQLSYQSRSVNLKEIHVILSMRHGKLYLHTFWIFPRDKFFPNLWRKVFPWESFSSTHWEKFLLWNIQKEWRTTIPTQPRFSSHGKSFHQMGIYFQRAISLPKRSEGIGTCPREIRWKFFQGKKRPAVWDDIFHYGIAVLHTFSVFYSRECIPMRERKT